jgi:hypothetical protein
VAATVSAGAAAGAGDACACCAFFWPQAVNAITNANGSNFKAFMFPLRSRVG